MSETKQHTLKIGSPVPSVSFVDTKDKTNSFAVLNGHRVILYFYPKDNTPGCTMESKAFRDHFKQFKALNTVIFGISRDSLNSHQNFKTKCEMPFELISDENSELCALFDVIKQKSMFGKKYMGIERSTFIIDEKGILIKAWRKVKVLGHVKAVLAYIESL